MESRGRVTPSPSPVFFPLLPSPFPNYFGSAARKISPRLSPSHHNARKKLSFPPLPLAVYVAVLSAAEEEEHGHGGGKNGKSAFPFPHIPKMKLIFRPSESSRWRSRKRFPPAHSHCRSP